MNGFSDALASLPETVFADLLESDTAYRLLVDLPGVSEETLDVTVAGPVLSIEARREKTAPEDFWFRREDRALFLDAEVPLPPDADGPAASASLEQGVLEITIPKHDESDTRVPIAG